MHFSILKFSILIHQHKDLQRCNICHCYAIHFLIESKNYFIGSQPSLTIPKDKLKNSTYSFTLILFKKKMNLSIVIIYLKYIIFKWLLPFGPKSPSQVSLGPCRHNNWEAVYSYEIYVYKVANFILAELHWKEAFVHICSSFCHTSQWKLFNI